MAADPTIYKYVQAIAKIGNIILRGVVLLLTSFPCFDTKIMEVSKVNRMEGSFPLVSGKCISDSLSSRCNGCPIVGTNTDTSGPIRIEYPRIAKFG